MSTTTTKLINLTDDELSAAVAEHVAGWTDTEIKVTGTGVFYGQTDVPPYSISADAVLPLLEKRDAIVTHSVKERDWRVVIEGGRCNSAPTLPRAACIALLRANGIEVEITPQPAQK